LVNLIND